MVQPSRDGSNDSRRGPAGFADWRTLSQSPLIRLAFFWILGSLTAYEVGHPLLFAVLGLVASVMAVIMICLKRSRGVQTWLLLAVFALSGAWLLLHTDRVEPDSVLRFVDTTPQLARLRGTVDSPAVISAAQVGHFAKFSYEPPETFALLNVDSIMADQQWLPASGTVMIKIQQIEDRLGHGDRVEAVGWLAGFDGPYNPGERDYQTLMRYREIDARLTLRRRGNWILLNQGSDHALQTIRQSFSDRAAEALRLGMQDHREALSLLNLLLLGRRGDVGDLHDRFRDVGLAHILAISGAHLAILLGMVWLIARLITPSPPRAALIVLIVLGLYLMMVPLKTPILRASIMAGVFCVGYLSGRVVRGLDMLALSAVIVLAWRPFDLFSPGFQLSFIVVGALILFARPLEAWPLPGVDDDQPKSLMPPTRIEIIWRWIWGYTAVSLVAFFAALPLVAYHFEMVTPFAVLLSVLALPLVTVILALGYLKILTGLLWPSVSLVLSGLLAWFADALIMLVDHARSWPGATLRLSQPPSAWWVFAVMAVLFALGVGVFRGRRVVLMAVVSIMTVWTMWPGLGATRGIDRGLALDWVLRVDTIAVGNGSCFLVRAGDFTMLFDAGSHDYLDVGERSIVPALRRLGVDQIDMMMLSHADLDHFSGSLAVAEALPVRRVAMSPQMLARGKTRPDGPTAFLIEEMAELGVPVEVISQGWGHEVMVQGDDGRQHTVMLELIWPDANWQAKWDNDMSLVLSIRAAGRRVLLNGDVQQAAMEAMFEEAMDLKADVIDLPHHGAFVAASRSWFERVRPTVALQSSGPERLFVDTWAEVFQDHQDIQRLITARHGLISVVVAGNGEITWRTFREDGQRDSLPVSFEETSGDSAASPK